LTGLPPVVQRYFLAVLTPGQPLVTAVSLQQRGTFNLSETGTRWKPFTADQRVITMRPGFDWAARIEVLPGIDVRVHDTYIAGEGIMQAAMFGLATVARMRGVSEMARGQLMRYLAEAAWYPTALLPSQGVTWQRVNERSARATITEDNFILSMLFRFNDANLIESVRAEARGRTAGDAIIPTPWEGHWQRYELHHNLCIPMEGEAAWLLTEGIRPYWRGRVTSLSYEFAR